jgi:hypothetical protein
VVTYTTRRDAIVGGEGECPAAFVDEVVVGLA